MACSVILFAIGNPLCVAHWFDSTDIRDSTDSTDLFYV